MCLLGGRYFAPVWRREKQVSRRLGKGLARYGIAIRLGGEATSCHFERRRRRFATQPAPSDRRQMQPLSQTGSALIDNARSQKLESYLSPTLSRSTLLRAFIMSHNDDSNHISLPLGGDAMWRKCGSERYKHQCGRGQVSLKPPEGKRQ